MIEFKKGDIVYYFIVYKDSSLPGLVQLEVAENYNGQYGISVPMIIKKIFTPQYVGSKNRIIVGKRISANELQGIGASGIMNYIFKSKEVIIKNIFEQIYK